MIRDLTLRLVKEAFREKGYTLEATSKSVMGRTYDVIEATIEAGEPDSDGNPLMFGIFAVCTIVHNNNNPRMHTCEFFDLMSGNSMSQVFDITGDVFVREVQSLLNQSGCPW